MTDFLLTALSQPALLVGLMTTLGLALQRSPLTDVVKGAIKATLGFVVLQCGAGVLVESLGVFGKLFEEAFAFQGVVPNNEAITSLVLQKFGFETSLVMFFGMIANIVVARLTPMKFIFLTGHHTLFMASLLVVVLRAASFSSLQTIVVGSLLLGLILSFFPFLVQWAMRRITGGDDFALGHFGSVGYLTAALIGLGVGKGSRSTEEFQFPKALTFFRETTVSIVLTMLPLFLIVSWIVLRKSGFVAFETVAGEGENVVVFCLMQSILFAAGIYIVLQGVRLILGEIIPAFKGISEKLVPDAKPALDCPLVFPYAPNAVILGFLSSFFGGLAGLLLCGWFHWTLILPGVIPHFFCGATAGVFGNATGGRRGCLVGAFVHGVLITLLPLLLLPLFAAPEFQSMGFSSTIFGDADFSVVGFLIAKFVAFF